MENNILETILRKASAKNGVAFEEYMSEIEKLIDRMWEDELKHEIFDGKKPSVEIFMAVLSAMAMVSDDE